MWNDDLGRGRVHRRKRFLVAVALVLVAGGCTEGDRGATPGEYAMGWELDTTGTLDLHAPAEEPLFRAVSATVLNDTTYVLESSSNRIRVFGPDGILVRTMGGRGEGPSEFTSPRGLASRDGSIVVWDGSLDKVVVFPQAPAEDVRVRSTKMPDGTRPGTVLGVLDNGMVILSRLRGGGGPIFATAPEVTRGVGELTLLHLATGDTTSVGSFQFSERYQEPTPGGGSRSMTPLFGIQGGIFVGRSIVAVVGRSDGRIEIRNPTGSIQGLASDSSNTRRAITDHDWLNARNALVDLAEEQSPGMGMRETVDRMPRPDSMPHWGWQGNLYVRPLHIDNADRVWTLRYGMTLDRHQVWSVFSPEAALLGTVRITGEGNIIGFGPDEVVLQRWDEDGVESVSRIPLPTALREGH